MAFEALQGGDSTTSLGKPVLHHSHSKKSVSKLDGPLVFCKIAGPSLSLQFLHHCPLLFSPSSSLLLHNMLEQTPPWAKPQPTQQDSQFHHYLFVKANTQQNEIFEES